MSQGTPEQPGKWQVTVFLAYASEDENLAVAVQAAINKHGTSKSGAIAVKKWPLNSEFTESILGNVLSSIRQRDFGVFIYSPVDGKARDNVVFETGLFIGIKGRDHTVILLPENHEVAPSDLSGILTPKYPYDQLQDVVHLDRVDILDEVGLIIADRIRTIMAQSSPRQEQPDTEQPQSGTRTEQPPTAAETISRGLASLAAMGKLTRVPENVSPGRIVVHATYGVVRVMGFDPEGADPRYVDVQFGSVIGRYRDSELFMAPIDL